LTGQATHGVALLVCDGSAGSGCWGLIA
jgi:hypothetical protein